MSLSTQFLAILIVREKESRLRESLRMFGVTDVQHFLSYILFFSSWWIIMSTLGAFVWSYVFVHSSPFIIFLWIFLSQLSLASLGFFVSTICKKTSNVSGMFLVLLIVSYSQWRRLWSTDSSHPIRLLALLLPPVCYFNLFNHFFNTEAAKFLVMLPRLSNESLHVSLFMLVVDSFFWLLIALYLNRVLPSAYGVRRPWYFPFSSSFWRTLLCHQKITFEQERMSLNPKVFASPEDSEYFEEINDPYDKVIGVSIHGISKSFPKDKGTFWALENVSIQFLEGEILVLLGYNGSGKTTLISILTGLLVPTCGDALVYGYSIRKHMDLVQQMIGVCPQENVLYGELSVEDHIKVFAQLKLLDASDSSVLHALEETGLQGHRKAKVKTLSGGLKRKLCFALALVGNPKVIFLDEPSSGLDIESRHMVWDIIQKLRSGRVVVLTTHHVEEAEILGDRIVFLDQGRIRCYGSPMFIKKAFKSGYQVVLEHDSAEKNAVTLDAVQKLLKTAEIEYGDLASIDSQHTVIVFPFDNRSSMINALKLIEESKLYINSITLNGKF
jgi:ABC-type multidrug transport system ATPase subunit